MKRGSTILISFYHLRVIIFINEQKLSMNFVCVCVYTCIYNYIHALRHNLKVHLQLNEQAHHYKFWDSSKNLLAQTKLDPWSKDMYAINQLKHSDHVLNAS